MDLKKAWKDRELGYEIVAEMRREKLRTLSREQWLHGLRVVWSIREPDQSYFRLALGIQRQLRRAGMQFCFIGGLALQRWGEGRYTEDIDLTVLCPLGIEEPLRCCSPEDLTITKTVAGRGQDWVDLARIVQRSGRDVDWDLVFEELDVLLQLAELPKNSDRLREIVADEGLE